MPRYDPDLIAALAEGRLDPDEATRLERELVNDPEAFQALEAQRAAIAALAASASPALTEVERAGLRASIADALGLAEPAATTETAPRRVAWGSLGIAAAALFGLIAIVPVVGLLNTSGGDDAATAIELAPEAATSPRQGTTAESGGADAADDAAAVPESAVSGDGSFEADETPGDTFLGFGSTTQPNRSVTDDADNAVTTTTIAAAAESTSTTAAPTTTEPAGESTTTTSVTTTTSGRDLDALVSELTAIWEDAETVKSVSSEADAAAGCWDEDTEFRGEEPEDRWTFEYDDGTWLVAVFFVYDAQGDHGPFQVYDLPDCEALTEVP